MYSYALALMYIELFPVDLSRRKLSTAKFISVGALCVTWDLPWIGVSIEGGPSQTIRHSRSFPAQQSRGCYVIPASVTCVTWLSQDNVSYLEHLTPAVTLLSPHPLHPLRPSPEPHAIRVPSASAPITPYELSASSRLTYSSGVGKTEYDLWSFDDPLTHLVCTILWTTHLVYTILYTIHTSYVLYCILHTSYILYCILHISRIFHTYI